MRKNNMKYVLTSSTFKKCLAAYRDSVWKIIECYRIPVRVRGMGDGLSEWFDIRIGKEQKLH